MAGKDETAFDAPAATKRSTLAFPDGTTLNVQGSFTTVVRYARQATGEFRDGEGNTKPGEHQPFAVFETDNGRVAIGDAALRTAIITEIKE
jgi:hypothetical protein